jgi:hypothetical protein
MQYLLTPVPLTEKQKGNWISFLGLQTGSLKPIKMYYLAVLETRSSRSRCQQGRSPFRTVVTILASFGFWKALVSLVCSFMTPTLPHSLCGILPCVSASLHGCSDFLWGHSSWEAFYSRMALS